MAGVETQTGQGAIAEHRELEPQATRVVFYGFPHHELNLEGIPHIVDAFRDGLERKPTKATLFLETHFLPESDARHWERLTDALGGLANLRVAQLIAEQDHKLPTRDEIDDKRAVLEGAEFDELVATGVLPTKYVEPFYFAREIDKLRQEFSFDIAFESHNPELARTLEGMQKGSLDLQHTAHEYFTGKNFNAFLRDWKSHMQLEQVLKATRHTSNLRDINRRLGATGDGGFLFVLAGASHLPLADELRASLREGSRVQVEEASHLDYTEHGYYKVHKALNEGEAPDDTTYAHEFMDGVIGGAVLDEMDTRLGNREALRRFANNFELIYNTVQRLATSLSLEEIRAMSLGTSKVSDYLNQNPDADPIKRYVLGIEPSDPRSKDVFQSPELEEPEDESVKVRSSQEIPVELLENDPLQQFVDGKSISLRDAQMLHLHYREKLPFDKVGERLGLSQNTIRQYTSNAFRRLPDEVRRQLRGN